jgi:hypothetical protein
MIRIGLESAVWGLLLALIALPTLLRGGLPLALVSLLVIGLVCHGLFVIVQPYPKGIVVENILKCGLGCVLIAASLPETHFILIRAWLLPWWLIGLAEIATAVTRTTHYKRLSHVSGSVPSEWLSYIENLVRTVTAAPRHDPSILEVVKRSPLGTEKMKVQLYSELAVFVGPHKREVLIADRSDFALGQAGKGPIKKLVSAEMRFGDRTIRISASRECYQKLAEWSDLGIAGPAMQLSNATA